MATTPKKVQKRFTDQVPKYQQVLQDAKNRDVNETDTAAIVKDILAGVFGFDRYQEITSEFAVRGTYCDFAVQTGSEIHYLVEVKAIGLILKESHVKQAIDYGANKGIPYVVLTNGLVWEIYHIKGDVADLIDFST